MSTKSSQHRALRKSNERLWKCSEVHYEQGDWELDNLADSGLDTILSIYHENPEAEALPSSVYQKDVFPSISKAQIHPLFAQKRESSMPGFFDLPPEIRMAIYEIYCQDISSQSELSDKRLPVTLLNVQSNYYGQLIRPQLLCHQLREELLTAWAQRTTFVVSYFFRHWVSNLTGKEVCTKQLYQTKPWIQIRNLLDRINPLARRHVRKIRLTYVWKMRSGWPDDRLASVWSRQTSIIDVPNVRNNKRMFEQLERLEDVHENLEIELEIQFLGLLHAFRAKRRIFTLRQLPCARNWQHDWLCDVGEMHTMRTDHDRREVDRIMSNWHEQAVKDELWLPVEEPADPDRSR